MAGPWPRALGANWKNLLSTDKSRALRGLALGAEVVKAAPVGGAVWQPDETHVGVYRSRLSYPSERSPAVSQAGSMKARGAQLRSEIKTQGESVEKG